jgi:hypothetical protein
MAIALGVKPENPNSGKIIEYGIYNNNSIDCCISASRRDR